jgi:hypothetical protein
MLSSQLECLDGMEEEEKKKNNNNREENKSLIFIWMT